MISWMHNLQLVYDAYIYRMSWRPPEGLRIYGVTGGKSVNGDNIINNAYSSYNPQNKRMWVITGVADGVALSASFEIIAHEFTHGVMSAYAQFERDKMEVTTVLEGVADVMAICISGDESWHYAEGYRDGRDLANPKFDSNDKVYYKTDDYAWFERGFLTAEFNEQHDFGQVIGHAAYLMNKGTHSSQAMSLDTIGNLFYLSFHYATADMDMDDLGLGLIIAAQELCYIKDERTGQPYMTQSQVERVRWALDTCDISDTAALPHDFRLTVRDEEATPFGDYTVEIYPNFDDAPVLTDRNAMYTREIHIKEAWGRIVLSGKSDPQQKIKFNFTCSGWYPQTAVFELYVPFARGQANEEQLLHRYYEERVKPQYGVMDTQELYMPGDDWNVTWDTACLEGVLNDMILDFDGDGAKELLVSRFHAEPGQYVRRARLDELYLTLSMYEAEPSGVTLAAEKTLQIYGIIEQQGSLASSAGGFLYARDKYTAIALDTFYGSNEYTVTLCTYVYDGANFRYAGGVGFQNYGEGDLLIRAAAKEEDWRLQTSCADWRGYLLGLEDTAWQTVERYDMEENDYVDPSDDIRQWYFDKYRELAGAMDVVIDSDARIMRDKSLSFEEANARQYQQTLDEIYGNSGRFMPLWRITSWMPAGGSKTLQRERLGGE